MVPRVGARLRPSIAARVLARLAAFGLVLSVLLVAAPAPAHIVGLSQSDFTVAADGTAAAMVVFSKPDALRLGRIDRDGDGLVSPSELAASEAVFREEMERGVILRVDHATCTAKLEGGGDVAEEGFGLAMSFTCPAPSPLVAPRALEIELPILSRPLWSGHRHVLRVTAGATSVQRILTATNRSASMTLPQVHANANAAPSAGSSSLGPALRDALRLGVEHILTGWDHLLFLAAVILGTRGWKSLVAAVSAFTVAHSITLAIAALGVFCPSPRWIEPIIAASIAFVAFENAFRAQPAHRWRITFLFGLVHGFGFAGALQDLALDRARLVPTLLGFNLGVEAGQLGVVLLALPIVARLRRHPTFEARWIRGVSLAMGIVGTVLCAIRIAPE
ncbi:HupE/UreJ family protein [Pendulispora albinea]|uniref:HupE/UreJ family protein n=1 Tax=Pendulispora albinea TaxID=2741071 RepID=A0ABZ2LRJ1_9BACT